MDLQVLTYPFLFLAIFFESFVLVTLLSKPARASRARAVSTTTPTVAIIVPCWNEGETIAGTADSLLALDYPTDKLRVILVDDGSTDSTPAVLARYAHNPQVEVITKANGGKYTAVNAGIAATTAEIIGCLDADSYVEPGTLREMLPCFDDPKVAATTPAMSVTTPQNLLQHMQNAEYIFGITLKHALSTVGGIHVTPGPFSLYRRQVVLDLGGFKHAYQTEDLEMALRLQQAGWQIDNAPRARVYTNAPRTVGKLVKQRTRWTSGYLRNVLNDYRGMLGSWRYGALGAIVLPLGITMIVSSIGMFFISLTLFAQHAFAAYQVRQGIPLSYSLALHGGFDWFYLPGSLYLLLAMLTVVASIAMITVGKRLSRTPGSLSLGLVAYVLLYGFVAPLWLMRASYDVALGRKRSWR